MKERMPTIQKIGEVKHIAEFLVKRSPNWQGWKMVDKEPHPIETNTFFNELNPLVHQFYKLQFWDKLKLENMGQALATQLLDYGVNSGKKRAIRSVQKALRSMGFNILVDGIIGKNTLKSIMSTDNDNLAKLVLEERGRFIEYLIIKQPHFAHGWRYRLSILRRYL